MAGGGKSRRSTGGSIGSGEGLMPCDGLVAVGLKRSRDESTESVAEGNCILSNVTAGS